MHSINRFRLSIIAGALLVSALRIAAQPSTNTLSIESASNAEKLFGLDFGQTKDEALLRGLQEQLKDFETIRRFHISNSVPPALVFNPLPVGFALDRSSKKFKLSSSGKVHLPANPDDSRFIQSVSWLAWSRPAKSPPKNSPASSWTG